MLNIVVSFVAGGLVGILVVFRAFRVMPNLLMDYMLTGGRNTSVASILKGFFKKPEKVKEVEEHEVDEIVNDFNDDSVVVKGEVNG